MYVSGIDVRRATRMGAMRLALAKHQPTQARAGKQRRHGVLLDGRAQVGKELIGTAVAQVIIRAVQPLFWRKALFDLMQRGIQPLARLMNLLLDLVRIALCLAM